MLWWATALVALWAWAEVACGCEYSKYSYQHTMCSYGGPACQLKTRGVSKQDIQVILNEHNKYRQRVALGLNHNHPPAANMRQMEWDNELAVMAQKWAEQCKTQHDCSDCRELPRFRVGQNIYMFASTADNTTTDWQTASWEWFKEISIFSSHKIEPFQHPHAAGHYTQLAWANSYKIGCGYVYFYKGRWFTKLYICDYGPGGNILGDRMYMKGAACSACPQGTSCSGNYNGLCASGGGGGGNAVAPHTPWWQTTPAPAPDFKPWVVFMKPSTQRPPIYAKPGAKRTLLYCDFDAHACNAETMGTALWKQVRSGDRARGAFYEAYVNREADAHLYVYTADEDKGALGGPGGGAFGKACVTFMYLKYSLFGRTSSNLEVAIWRHSHDGPYAEYLVATPAHAWNNYRITVPAFPDIYSVSFHMIVPSHGADHYVAVDQVRLTTGPCNS